MSWYSFYERACITASSSILQVLDIQISVDEITTAVTRLNIGKAPALSNWLAMEPVTAIMPSTSSLLDWCQAETINPWAPLEEKSLFLHCICYISDLTAQSLTLLLTSVWSLLFPANRKPEGGQPPYLHFFPAFILSLHKDFSLSSLNLGSLPWSAAQNPFLATSMRIWVNHKIFFKLLSSYCHGERQSWKTLSNFMGITI